MALQWTGFPFQRYDADGKRVQANAALHSNVWTFRANGKVNASNVYEQTF